MNMINVRADGGMNAELAKTITEFAAEFAAFKDTLNTRVMDVEQRYAASDHGGHQTARSPGAALADQLLKSDAWSAVANKRQTKSSIDVNAGNLLPNVQANTITYDTGGLSVVERTGGIVSGMQRRRWLRERFLPVATTGGSVEYQRELTFTNNAAPQGGGSPFLHEGVAKAESAITYETVEVKIPTIAHFVKASKQILADAPLLGATLDQRLLYGLEIAVESQLIAGDGTGANMSGLTASGNFTAFTPTTGETAIDSISRAIAALEGDEAHPDVIVMNPSDYRAMQRLKASGSGEFLFGAPGGSNNEAVWNKDVHITPAMTAGSFIAMDTQQMGVLFTREDANVTVGWVDDDFTKNLSTILAETRLTLAVQRPAAVRYGSLVV